MPQWVARSLLWFGLFVFGLLLAVPSLNADWFNDDLHFIRPYTGLEIAGAMTGNFFPNPAIATVGYRPLTTLYYHTLGTLVGENVVLVRVLQTAIFALALTILADVARMLGLSITAAGAACLIVITFRNTWWMLTWPADGVRAWMLMWAAAGFWCGIRYMEATRWARVILAAAIVCYGFAIFIREEAFVFAVLIPIFALFKYRNPWRALHLFVACGAVTICQLLLRFAFTPSALGVTQISFDGLPLMSLYTYAPRLFEGGPLWLAVISLIWVWTVALVGVRQNPRSLLWLTASLIALAPTLIVARANNLLFPLVFLGFFFADTLMSPHKINRWQRIISRGALLLLCVGGFISHRHAQNTLAADSVDRVLQANEYLYGEWQYALNDIPLVRIASLERAAVRTPHLVSRWLSGGWSFP